MPENGNQKNISNKSARNLPHRRNSLRLPNYDYHQTGWYFITICTKDRKEIFGRIRQEKMVENNNGNVTRAAWQDLPNHYHCILGEFIIMPNHVHGIIIIPDVRAGLKPAPTGGRISSVSEIIRGFKTFSARRINEEQGTTGKPVWQRGFYDHIIRDEHGLENIVGYIRNNPAKWSQDRNNPMHRT